MLYISQFHAIYHAKFTFTDWKVILRVVKSPINIVGYHKVVKADAAVAPWWVYYITIMSLLYYQFHKIYHAKSLHFPNFMYIIVEHLHLTSLHIGGSTHKIYLLSFCPKIRSTDFKTYIVLYTIFLGLLDATMVIK